MHTSRCYTFCLTLTRVLGVGARMLTAVLFITGKTTNLGNHPTADQPNLDKLRPVSHTAVLQSSENEAASLRAWTWMNLKYNIEQKKQEYMQCESGHSH